MFKRFLELSMLSVPGVLSRRRAHHQRVLTGCAANDDLYALHLGYSNGGFLGGSKVFITINGHRRDFFGEDYSTVSIISGTDMSCISDLVKEGENTIGLEIVPSGGISEEKEAEPFVFRLTIEHLKKGDVAVTGAQGNVFYYSVRLKPGDPVLKWEKTFVVRTSKTAGHYPDKGSLNGQWGQQWV